MIKAGMIGCGRPRSAEGSTGFGMAHAHAAGYQQAPDTRLVAAADISQENLDAYCAEYDIPNGYRSAKEMLAKESLDIVSICLWPHLHAEYTILAAEAGVKAIHCEKPMALTWEDSRRMVEVCEANGVQLTFNHMRRFGPPFRKARELLDAGAIGELERLEGFTSNLYDWGTHWFDMLCYYNRETPVEWVIGQIDARGGHPIFGAMVEGQGLSQFRFANGVTGILVTGFGQKDARDATCGNRLIGSAGTIEVGVQGGPDIRLRNAETDGAWQAVDIAGGMHGRELHALGVVDAIEALREGREPELSGRRALRATELIFATWESSRRRGRVDLPLDTPDSAFVSMLNDGDLCTWPPATVEANGIHQHYRRTGSGDGSKPPLILCHGFSDNGLCWTPLARALAATHDLFLVDARGHGESEKPETGYTVEDRADDLAAFVQALGLEKPAVLGHSMGGATAAFAAAKYPQLFGRILLEDPGWRNPVPGEKTSDAEREAAAEERRRQIVERSRLSRETLIAQCRQQQPQWSPEEIGPWALSKQQLSPHVAGSIREQRPDWREVVKGITGPVLLITADPERGAIVTAEMAEQAQSLNANLRVARIEGAGHCIRRDALKPYLQAVQDFLAP